MNRFRILVAIALVGVVGCDRNSETPSVQDTTDSKSQTVLDLSSLVGVYTEGKAPFTHTARAQDCTGAYEMPAVYGNECQDWADNYVSISALDEKTYEVAIDFKYWSTTPCEQKIKMKRVSASELFYRSKDKKCEITLSKQSNGDISISEMDCFDRFCGIDGIQGTYKMTGDRKHRPPNN